MEYTPYYPVFLSLKDRLAVVVGGGDVAERKIETLLRYGPRVLVVAPDLTTALEELEESCAITVERRGYVRGDLEGAAIVICATDDNEVNRAVFAEAEERGCLVNVVDVTDLCNFIVPSVVHRGPFQIAISTAGAAPAVAKRVRRKLSAEFGDEWGTYVSLLGELRARVMQRIEDPEQRKRMFEWVADSDLLSRIKAGEVPDVEDLYIEVVRADDSGGRERS
jgi:precorrin-2 dehydrogenase / sirohydrochlorin ferrochelatase